jgi:hypothetical protein
MYVFHTQACVFHTPASVACAFGTRGPYTCVFGTRVCCTRVCVSHVRVRVCGPSQPLQTVTEYRSGGDQGPALSLAEVSRQKARGGAARVRVYVCVRVCVCARACVRVRVEWMCSASMTRLWTYALRRSHGLTRPQTQP